MNESRHGVEGNIMMGRVVHLLLDTSACFAVFEKLSPTTFRFLFIVTICPSVHPSTCLSKYPRRLVPLSYLPLLINAIRFLGLVLSSLDNVSLSIPVILFGG